MLALLITSVDFYFHIWSTKKIQIQKAQFSDQTSEKEIVYALDEVMWDA